MAIEDLQPLPRKSYRKRVVPFTAGDGFLCDLIHVRGPGTPAKGPVILANRPRLVAPFNTRRPERRWNFAGWSAASTQRGRRNIA